MAVSRAKRTDQIVATLIDHFEPLMEADPAAFRGKFRKMAKDPFAFYRGTACLFYDDMARLKEKWVDARTSRVWIQGDLHAENFGTYMNSHGQLVFDVNDFDEAYIGHFTWDLRRFVASLFLLGWQKALPDDDLRELAAAYLHGYVDQVHAYVDGARDSDFALRLDNTDVDSKIHKVLIDARKQTRVGLLNSVTEFSGGDRRFVRDSSTRDLSKTERRKVERAFDRYLETIPDAKRAKETVYYDIKDIVGKKGFGIGSAGLPAYNVLIEGFSQAFENDVVLTIKQGNVSAVSRVVQDPEVVDHFENDGHRTVLSQRALQVHADRFLGWTTIDKVGFVVSEFSPYEADLEWDDLTEPDAITDVVSQLGRATAKAHCASDADSDEGLVTFQTEQAISEVIGDDVDGFIDDLVTWGARYSEDTRRDHTLFVDAFRDGRFDLVSAT